MVSSLLSLTEFELELMILSFPSQSRAIMFHIGIAVQHPPLPEPHQLSELGIDFIRQCLDIDPDKRPSAEELMLHPWIQEATAQISAAYEEESTPPGSYSKGTGSPAYDDSSYSQEPEGNSGRKSTTIKERMEITLKKKIRKKGTMLMESLRFLKRITSETTQLERGLTERMLNSRTRLRMGSSARWKKSLRRRKKGTDRE